MIYILIYLISVDNFNHHIRFCSKPSGIPLFFSLTPHCSIRLKKTLKEEVLVAVVLMVVVVVVVVVAVAVVAHHRLVVPW